MFAGIASTEDKLFAFHFRIDDTFVKDENFRTICALKGVIVYLKFANFTEFTLVKWVELK